jgi:hypothetical protein
MRRDQTIDPTIAAGADAQRVEEAVARAVAAAMAAERAAMQQRITAAIEETQASMWRQLQVREPGNPPLEYPVGEAGPAMLLLSSQRFKSGGAGQCAPRSTGKIAAGVPQLLQPFRSFLRRLRARLMSRRSV